MALELQNRVVSIVQNILRAELADTPSWLVRPGRVECGSEWDRISYIYTTLTGLKLPEAMRPVERRTVDAVLLQKGHPPRILEVDEKQHFNEFRAVTLTHYGNAPVAFDTKAWLAASVAKRKLEGGGFAKAMLPLFPDLNGRHRQRAFRDAVCDLIPPLHGFAPTLRIADFEVKSWIYSSDAEGRMVELLSTRLKPGAGQTAIARDLLSGTHTGFRFNA